MQNLNIVLEAAKPEELAEFCRRMQRAFTAAVLEKFGESEPIPSDQEVWQAIEAPNARVYQIVHDGQKAGGVVLSIDERTRRNSLELFFIDLEQHNQGLGLAVWRAIEALYPQTKIWETVTPYFEQRNIHFLCE